MRHMGLITQTRDEADRRRQFIQITDAGQKIIADRATQTAQITAGFRATLGDDNYETLLDLLAILDPGSRN
jgi:DNA-binding MarR family transcriptional regulator